MGPITVSSFSHPNLPLSHDHHLPRCSIDIALDPRDPRRVLVPGRKQQRHGCLHRRLELQVLAAILSVAAFILETMSREAARVIEDETHWRLGIEESAKIQRLLAKPPAINAAAKKAAKDLAAHVRIRS